MALNPEQVDRLIEMLRQTQDVELTCPECLQELERYAQGTLDGQPLEGLLARVREHLEACPFCNEEYQLVLETLKAIDD
jgi:uncharacterized protein with PIN domain